MESRNPVGYEKDRLYRRLTLLVQRVPTYIDMIKSYTDPSLFIIDNDEVTGKQDALYFYSGIESRLIESADVTTELLNLASQVTGNAEQTALDRQQTGQDRQAITDLATTVSNQAGQVADDREAAEDARDEALTTIPITVNNIDDLVLPRVKGFVLVLLDTNFSDTPKKQLYYNDGTAAVKGDLYTMPFDQLKNLI